VRIVATRLRDCVHSDPVISSVALYIASLIEIGQQTSLTRLEITGIAWGVNLASGIINTIGTKAISRMSSFNVWWTVGGTLVLVITLLVKAPERVSFSLSIISRTLRILGQNTASFVFTDYEKFESFLVCERS